MRKPRRHPRDLCLLLYLLFIGCSSCTTIGPDLPQDLQGNSLIVLGFTANQSRPYEGGTLFTGLHINKLDGQPVEPAMTMYDYRIVESGEHTVEGFCYWRLRGVLTLPDDLHEPGKLTIATKPNHRYTIQSHIDEYKNRCMLTTVETEHHANQ